MPRARKGKSGPKSSAAGKKGTNRATPHKGAGTSGTKTKGMAPHPPTSGYYHGTSRSGGKGY
jgi:hypothetical protein